MVTNQKALMSIIKVIMVRQIQHFLILLFCLVSTVCLFSLTANAQGGVVYDFLEVVDFEDKPVADTKVDVKGSCVRGEYLTNQKGQLEKGFPIGLGDCSTSDFTISKEGFYSFRDVAIFRFEYRNNLLRENFNKYSFKKVELLKVPKTKAEQNAIGKEQLKRELFWAIAEKNAVKVEELLKTGISPHITTDDLRGFPGPHNLPAIIFAASIGGIETVKPFLKAGVNLRDENSPYKNILSYYMTNYPLSHRSYEPPKTEEDKLNLISYQDGVDVLIDAGVNLNITNKSGINALMISASNGDVRTVKTLLTKNIPIDQTDDSERTALTHATFSNYESTPNKIEIAEQLLKNGANPNHIAKGFEGKCTTPLINAVANTNPTLVKVLLKNGANVNLACSEERTALSRAINFPNYYRQQSQLREIIKILEEAGAKYCFC